MLLFYRSESNVPYPVEDNDALEEEEEISNENEEELEITDDSLQLDGTLNETSNDISNATTQKEKRNRQPRGTDKLINFMKEKYEHKTKNKEVKQQPDDIDLFCASIARSMRKLPRRLQNKVKVDMLNSMARAEDEAEWYSSLPPVPSGNAPTPSVSLPSTSSATGQSSFATSPTETDQYNSGNLLLPLRTIWDN